MPIYYPDILEQKNPPRTFAYTDKDVMLYALGIGMGADPMDEKELAFVYEKGLKVVPTAATVLMSGGGRPNRQAAAAAMPPPREGWRPEWAKPPRACGRAAQAPAAPGRHLHSPGRHDRRL